MPKGVKGFQKGHKQLNTGKTHFKKGVYQGFGFTKGHKIRLGKKHKEETKRKISLISKILLNNK